MGRPGLPSHLRREFWQQIRGGLSVEKAPAVWTAAVISDSGPSKSRGSTEIRSAGTTPHRRFSQELKDELCPEVISTSKSIKDVAVTNDVVGAARSTLVIGVS